MSRKDRGSYYMLDICFAGCVLAKKSQLTVANLLINRDETCVSLLYEKINCKKIFIFGDIIFIFFVFISDLELLLGILALANSTIVNSISVVFDFGCRCDMECK